MSKEIYISSTPHETRLAIVENDALTEIYYERENEYTLAGSIYNGKVTRVLPGMQSSFVDIGLERDAFLYITDFMEEAGDSADFDSGDGNRGEGGRGRGNRDTERAALPAPDVSAESSEEPRNAGERNGAERNGNDRGGRGRGRRGRSGNRDRQPAAAQPNGDAPLADAPEADFSRQPASERDSAAPSDGSDLGEGAPGADGSRRWRGRRGRRRGRGQGRPEAGQQSANGAPAEAAPAGNEPDEFDEENGFEIDGAAAPAAPRSNTAPIASAYLEPIEHDAAAPREASSNRDDRGNRDRGGRGRGGRERNERGGRDARAPRGFAPRTDLYGVDAAPAYGEPAQSDVPAGEPIILPGESLSKYRSGSSEPAASAEPVAAAPAPDFVVSGWDGSAVLPGETLRRREPRPEQQREPRREREPRAEHRQDSRSNFNNQEVASAPAPVAHIEPVPAAVALPEIATPKAIAEPVVEKAEPTEYEPTEASASFRVDPVAPSEYRQSAPPVIEEELVEEEVVEEQPHFASAPILADHHEAELPSTHSITPQPEEVVAQLHAEVTPELPAHDITTLHATGEMHSEPVVAETLAPQQAVELEAPAAHEHMMIEEETFDDEDFHTTLHASAIEELDDLDEEETLEGAADLGTMIREMSIDEITRAGADEDEDDLEEEDSLHDEFDETEEESDDEEDDFEESGSEEEDNEQAEDDLLRDSAVPQPNGEANSAEGAAPAREGARDRGRSRRSGRDRGRDRDRGRSRDDRPRNTGGGGDRERSGGRRDGRSGRHSMQSVNLPAISDLLKPGQEVLVQIAKEPIAKKGARITSHIALPGRFLVFMPTVNHTGVSRKIESDGERRRLKEILLSEKGDATGGFIVRTAASGASEEELRSDLRFLLNLWADIKSRSESSKSPALIYHDLNLVERILRDQVTDNFSAIWVDTETDYERILRFLQRFQPSLIRRVKLYTKEAPLFEQFGITEEINKALRSKVWLKSGGSIVINQTEALVAIDINTGKFVGKTARLEDTIVKTNLDAIPEIVRQIRLRDLGGIIIIDFIDMDERKNRNKVMAALEEELKSDRAPSKILQFNDFGLVAITRKRVKQSLERTLSTTCGVCQGTGMVKSPITVCNDIYIEMRKMHKHLDRGDVMLRVHPDVVKQLKSSTKWLQEMEEMVGKTILVKSDPALHPEQFDIH
jgi:ribonuclease E